MGFRLKSNPATDIIPLLAPPLFLLTLRINPEMNAKAAATMTSFPWSFYLSLLLGVACLSVPTRDPKFALAPLKSKAFYWEFGIVLLIWTALTVLPAIYVILAHGTVGLEMRYASFGFLFSLPVVGAWKTHRFPDPKKEKPPQGRL